MPKFVEFQSIGGPAVTIPTELIQDCRPTERYAPDKTIVAGTQIFLKGSGSVFVLGSASEVTAKLNGDDYILTKREQFAAMAMQGLCACDMAYGSSSFEETAKMAVEQADALIEGWDSMLTLCST
jgi:hypothetical protein